jgi:hypothetical protein
MARKASSKPESCNTTASIGYGNFMSAIDASPTQRPKLST